MMKSKLFILCFLAVCQVCQANFLPVNLKVNGLSNPVGIDTSNPTFSWQTESDERGFLQSAYELVVRSASGAEVWKSGKVESALQNQCVVDLFIDNKQIWRNLFGMSFLFGSG